MGGNGRKGKEKKKSIRDHLRRRERARRQRIKVLGNQANTVIWLNFQEPSGMFL